MKKTTVIGLALLLVIGIFAAGVSAIGIQDQKNNMQFGKENPMKTTLESGDYDAYLESFEESDRPFIKHKLTEEKFNERSEHIQERIEQREERREKMNTAIQGGYDIWSEYAITLDHKPANLDLVTEDNFETFVKLHEARESQDFDLAKDYADELGFEKPEHKQQGEHKQQSNQMKQGMYKGMRQRMNQMNQENQGRCPFNSMTE